MSSTVPAEQDLRYPVGRLERKNALTAEERSSAIDAIAAAPANLRRAIDGLTKEQLDTPYRPGGWTVRQVAHHLADSHMNAYLRFKFAVTEDNPTVKPYNEADWAKLEDSMTMPPEPSMAILDALHARLVTFLRATSAESFARTLMHPENGPMTLDALLSVYSWHGRHHVGHVTALRERMSWS